MNSFLTSTLGRTGRQVFRLGLSASYWPGESAIRYGIDAGINYLFWYYWDQQMTRVLRDILRSERERYVVATGTSNFRMFLRHGLDACRRRLGTDYIDVFQVFWVGKTGFRPGVVDLLLRAKDDGKIRAIAFSTHHRRLAAELIRQGVPDVLMLRYNAAHRGAEEVVFPLLGNERPGIVTYTATRWRTLIEDPQPTAGDCYRFVLSNPNVDVCLTAPTNRNQLEDNLKAVAKGPLAEDEMRFMRRFGDAVHDRRDMYAHS
jgi:aryl-alcohol dehydrogenase-like predicted oxidoreductase